MSTCHTLSSLKWRKIYFFFSSSFLLNCPSKSLFTSKIGQIINQLILCKFLPFILFFFFLLLAICWSHSKRLCLLINSNLLLSGKLCSTFCLHLIDHHHLPLLLFPLWWENIFFIPKKMILFFLLWLSKSK